MSIRTTGTYLAGLLTPRKYDKILIQYNTITKTTHYGYFSTDIFVARTEIEVDGSGQEIRIQTFNDIGPF